MVDIVQFPRKRSLKEEAINRLCNNIIASLSVTLYELNILDGSPLQTYVRTVEKIMIDDPFDYDPEVVDLMAADPKHIERVRKMFLNAMINKGYLTNHKR